jgi:SAM-dependent methyltransferase
MKLMQLADACICCGGHDLASSPAVLMPFVASRALGQEPLEITAEWGLRDLKPGMAYTLCHSLQCRACGALFLDYRFTPAQMAALYEGYRGPAYTQQRERFEPGYAATVAQDYTRRHAYIAEVEAWLAPRLPERPLILDWGGGDGSNTPFLGRAQVQVHDISGAALAEGAERAAPRAAPDHDLLVCMQVLEHVADPLAVLQEMLPLMAPHTLLYLEVPHEALVRQHPPGTDLTPRKRHWHEHVNFFTENSLRRLAARAGLCVADTLRLPFDNGTRQGEVLGLLLTKEYP